jgi:hypothetical protein
MITTIPFSGFYCTLHESALDDAIEQMFSTDGCVVNNGLADRAQFECSWGDVRKAYAKEYAEQFSREFDIPLEFDSMESPKYYNFTTDRIFCRVPLEVCIRLESELPDNALADQARDMFTSRDGFSSFYSPDIDEWGDIAEWDHNQIGCLIEAYVLHQNPDFDQYAEYALMDDAQCNGVVWNWIDESTPNMGRLHKVFNYLEQRAKRA